MVTGGSGYIGTAFVRKLAEAGHKVVSTYRYTRPKAMPGVFPVCVDLKSRGSLVPILQKVDTVIHLAWQHGAGSAFQSQTMNMTNYQLTKQFIEWSEEFGIKKFVFASCLGVHQDSEEPWLMEKYLCEQALINSSIPSRLVLRSAPVHDGKDPNDRFIADIKRVLEKWMVCPLPAELHQIAPVDRGDYTDYLYQIVMSGFLKNGVLQLQGPEMYDLHMLFQLVSQRFYGKQKFMVKGAIGERLYNKLIRNEWQEKLSLSQKLSFRTRGRNLLPTHSTEVSFEQALETGRTLNS